MRAVLFDFHATLFHLDPGDRWFEGMDDVPEAVKVALMDRLTGPAGPSVAMSEHTRRAWAHRDLDPHCHREAHMHILKICGLPDEHATALYARITDPTYWTPYPDTVEVLEGLRANGIQTAVVSNIAWDVRGALNAAGTGADQYVLSYEVGVAKPDLRIFQIALARLGVPAADTLMVGDSTEKDGAAQQLGGSFALVDPLPTSQRPTGLLDALREHGITL